jgi:hypothetical protein
MKPQYLILFVIVLFTSALSAQVEIKGTKNTQVGQCTAGVNLGLSELQGELTLIVSECNFVHNIKSIECN